MWFPASHAHGYRAACMNGVHEAPILSEEVTSMACGKKCGTKATAKKKTAKKK